MYRIIMKLRRKNKRIQNEFFENEFLKVLNLKKEQNKIINLNLKKEILILETDDKIFLNKILNIITKLKLNNEELKILGLDLDIYEIKFEKIKSLLEEKNLTIEFLTPTVFKIGSIFKSEYSNYLFFSWLLKKFNKELSKEKKINISKEEMEKIIICDQKLENVEINLNNFLTNSFKGKIKLSFEKIDNEVINLFEKLLNYGIKNGIGYKNKIGYGKIKITY